ncbi:MAG: hypothetical protein K6V73_06460 [Firmicutes bacterium]|nr:hypothetical protein [Bacillota bacterium]
MTYPAMSLYIRIASVFSWVVAAAFFVMGLAALAAGAPGVVAMFLLWIVGFFSWLGIRILPELFQLLMRIEENTRGLVNPGAEVSRPGEEPVVGTPGV